MTMASGACAFSAFVDRAALCDDDYLATHQTASLEHETLHSQQYAQLRRLIGLPYLQNNYLLMQKWILGGAQMPITIITKAY